MNTSGVIPSDALDELEQLIERVHTTVEHLRDAIFADEDVPSPVSRELSWLASYLDGTSGSVLEWDILADDLATTRKVVAAL